jgi:hypothetical protein
MKDVSSNRESKELGIIEGVWWPLAAQWLCGPLGCACCGTCDVQHKAAYWALPCA